MRGLDDEAEVRLAFEQRGGPLRWRAAAAASFRASMVIAQARAQGIHHAQPDFGWMARGTAAVTGG
jgi:hypothetical protein